MYAFGWIADIGAGSLWVSECRNRSSERKLLEKKMGRIGTGAARSVILAGSTKRRTSALFELFQLEHVRSTEG
jgi:hypothetical protein